MKIVISLDNKKLKNYLENCKEEGYYIFVGEKNEEIKQLLNKPLFKEIRIDDYDEMFKEHFIREYIDLIGKLGLKYNSIPWWVTGTSAKNPFVSEVVEHLYLLHVIADKLKKLQEKNTTLVIIDPPREIVSSIQKYCLSNSIEFKTYADNFKHISEKVKGAAISLLVAIFFVLQTWKRIYLSKKYLNKNLHEIDPEKRYYVLRSWFYSSSFNEKNQYRDSFFGVLPDYLIKKGVDLIVIAGIWGDYKSILKKIAHHNDHKIFSQELFLGYFDPLKTVYYIITKKLKIDSNIDNFFGFGVSEIVQNGIDEEYKGKKIITILRDYLNLFIIEGLVKKIQIDVFTTTYENLPWEKMCFIGIRKYAPTAKIIGYQHAPLSRGALNMYLSKFEAGVIPLPDKIITTGTATKEILTTVGNYDEGKVTAGCALRLEIPTQPQMKERSRSFKILLVLGGILPRSLELLNFVHRSLKTNEKFKVVIRSHPALPLNRFNDKLEFNMSERLDFIISSGNSVAHDLRETDVVLYDASAISIEALARGVPVIHIALKGSLDFDPLFQCRFFRWNVRREEELLKVLDIIYNLDDEEYYNLQVRAMEYVKDYVHEVTDAKLNGFIID